MEGLHEGDALHAPEGHVQGDHGPDHHDPGPIGKPLQGRSVGTVRSQELEECSAKIDLLEDVGEGRACPFHLGHRVEESDEKDEHDSDLAEERGVVSAFGKVGDRIGTETPQRSGDEEQQEQVPTGIAHRVPQRIITAGHHHAGYPHERGGRKVFSGNGRRIPPHGHTSTGDEEIGGALGAARRPKSHAYGH